MAAPNEFDNVQQCANQNPELLRRNTEESILQFMMILGPTLRDEDAGWGYLTKSGGEKHLTLPDGQFIAVDAFIYNPTQQVIDVLSNAVDEGQAGPAWSEQPKRSGNNWYPIKDYEGGGGGGGWTGDDSAKNQEQDARIASLEARCAALESRPIGSIDGKKIALKAAFNDKYLRIRHDQPDKFAEATSDVSQSYEEFYIKDMG